VGVEGMGVCASLVRWRVCRCGTPGLLGSADWPSVVRKGPACGAGLSQGRPSPVPQQPVRPPIPPRQLCPCWGARRRYNSISDGEDEEDDFAGGKGGYAGRRGRSGSYQQQQAAARQLGGGRGTANVTVRPGVLDGPG
jgi:hypothetical protein